MLLLRGGVPRSNSFVTVLGAQPIALEMARARQTLVSSGLRWRLVLPGLSAAPSCVLHKSQIIGSFLFITDQQFAKTIEKRVRDLNGPAAGPEVRVAFRFFFAA